MTAQATLLCLPVNYPKPIMAKLLNGQSQAERRCYPNMLCASQSWAWEIMLSQNAMQLTLPIKEPAEAEKDETA